LRGSSNFGEAERQNLRSLIHARCIVSSFLQFADRDVIVIANDKRDAFCLYMKAKKHRKTSENELRKSHD
jgi:hypothetical protein